MQIFRTPPPVIFVLYSALIRNLIDQPFRIFPSQARISYGLTVYPVLINLLAAFLQIALDHHTFHQCLQFRIVVPAVKHFAYDPDPVSYTHLAQPDFLWRPRNISGNMKRICF